MRLPILLVIGVFGAVTGLSLAAGPPPNVENKVPLFPLGDEYREAWPPPRPGTPMPIPAQAKTLECEQLSVMPLEIEPLHVKPRSVQTKKHWGWPTELRIRIRSLITAFELLLPPQEL